jgi:hypothetical protein
MATTSSPSKESPASAKRPAPNDTNNGGSNAKKAKYDILTFTYKFETDVPRIDYDDLVVVLVGKEEQRFTIHKAILSAKLKFFQAALLARWLSLSDKERVVQLPEHSAAAFQSYFHWAYCGEVNLDLMPEKESPCDTERYVPIPAMRTSSCTCSHTTCRIRVCSTRSW